MDREWLNCVDDCGGGHRPPVQEPRDDQTSGRAMRAPTNGIDADEPLPMDARGEKADLLTLSYEELTAYVEGLGQKSFRARQIYEWLTRGADFDEMTNLPSALREALREKAVANPVSIRSVHVSKKDGTEKLLFELRDGNLIEGVLMRYHHGDTLCLSTQVGCRMGCAFCASTLEGCARDLTAGEMLGQLIRANGRLAERGEERRVKNVVLMGSGEPLDNYDNVIRFIHLAADERGLNQSVRGISLSTCGLVPKMDALAEEGLPVTLSLSLHAPNDTIRSQLMPVANAYPIEEVIAACRRYVEKTGRRAIIEYALIDGLNCEAAHADELAALLRGLRCHVNLIPLNEVKERNLYPPSARKVDAFLERLIARHISATKRREMGADIEGACGQLRRGVIDQIRGDSR